ncbi:hypothetical protein IQ03_03977 [Gemmobacter caeni]|uniref:Uncharacterized protein n=1 Tax=Gemmobacter caeni TaxID=589035 RepID=A0A2T6B974_9RHOB|nr:hypothetical protein [Gemmobacter caeni]PTX52603.1 hypothetical protein C8N34_102383 [Gemmobacter caeni]TWI94940.1 hypothetical protein IQ03_03977 [Gemmobacter caeni]
MSTRHLRKIRDRHRNSDAAAADRARRWALYGVAAFLTLCLIGFGLMVAGFGVPSWAWGRY